MGKGQYYRWNKKHTVEDYRCLDLKRLYEEGVVGKYSFSQGTWCWMNADGERVSSINYQADNDKITVSYTRSYDDKKFDYAIYFDKTKPHYGGVRYWFLCPNCNRRVMKLYAAGMFVCRHCLNLTYESRQEAEHLRHLSQAVKICRELGGDWFMDGGEPKKPKGMHWKTYHKKLEKMHHYEERANNELIRTFGRKFLQWPL